MLAKKSFRSGRGPLSTAEDAAQRQVEMYQRPEHFASYLHQE